MSHRLLKPHNGGARIALRRDSSQAPAWPNFQGTPQLVGTSPSGRVTVYIDQGFQDAMQNATDLVNDADRVVTANDALFHSVGSPVNVIVWQLNGASDGSGGADHASCDYVNGADIEVCASIGQSMRVSALFEAELSECSMGGNLCGQSTGEALSRWCAMAIGDNALSDFATAPRWAQDGYQNYVDQTDPTDQGVDSTGCGMAFLSWLQSLGYALDRIAPVMVSLGDQGTLAQLYAQLTGDGAANAWPKFTSALNGVDVTSDDPFGQVKPSQLAMITPDAARRAGAVFAAILADIASGKPEHEIVASVRAAMSGRSPMVSTQGAACSPKSHALRPPNDLR